MSVWARCVGSFRLSRITCRHTMADQSRNVWIAQDDPKLVSQKDKDVYEDILEERRKSRDLWYVTRSRDIPTFKHWKQRSTEQLKVDVLKSDRVKYAIEAVSREMQLPISEVTGQAKAIMDEMAHNLRMGAIRFFAYFLVKTMKQLFERIYVNKEQVEKVRSLIKEYPVLVMPTHRSYLDFLLTSYIFYHYDLPLPAIAAAMDFMGMKFFGWLLRNSGAFYIRRSFGDDQLYWAVFTEYVQTQISNSDQPIEFYVEGTRSRTGKSYSPKFGMLTAALEPYFKSHIPDIQVVPVSISYERVLEESLYSYELLGVPKPRESTSGLIKARKILDEDFGNVHVHFGDPISIREYTEGRVDRSAHNLAPRYIASLTDEEMRMLKSFGHYIILRQLEHMVISPWSLVATVMLQTQGRITLTKLVEEVEWLKKQAANLGAALDWPGNESPERVVRAHLALHRNVVEVTGEEDVVLQEVSCGVAGGQGRHNQLMATAAQHLMLCLYRNQLAHVFVRVGLLSLCINSCSRDSLPCDELLQQYAFLEKLLRQEFIFMPGATEKDFEEALLMLSHNCGVVVEDRHVVVSKSSNSQTLFFSQMFEPFLLGYWILCRYLLSLHPLVKTKPVAKPPKVLVREAQLLASRLLEDSSIRCHEVLSLNIMDNALNSLLQMAAVHKEKREGITYMYPDMVVLQEVADNIAKFIEVPSILSVSINIDAKKVVLNSKL